MTDTTMPKLTKCQLYRSASTTSASAASGSGTSCISHVAIWARTALALLLVLYLACSNTVLRAHALDNGLGRAPPMGFSTWNRFGGNVNDKLLREVADAMVANGLRDAGYTYVNLDDGWALNRSSNGTIVADPALFPLGIKAVADYVHSKGLKFGLYTARGSRTCMGRPGSDLHENIDAETYASWGVDCEYI